MSRKKKERTQAPPAASTNPSAPAAPRVRPKLPAWRLWLYRMLAVVLAPLLMLLAAEAVLWLLGIGLPSSFFLDDGGITITPTWLNNPDYCRLKMPVDLEPMPQCLPFELPQTKVPGTYRVFVLGESAAMGFPDVSTHCGRCLEVMLRNHYPATRFEVLNASMVAINSHVVRQIAQECARKQPDLFVVVLGNNEVIGPYGAASVLGPFTPSLWLIRFNMGLRATRCGQVLMALVSGRRAPTVWKGMETLAHSHLRADDPRLARIHENFQANLSDCCTAALAAGARVVVCTVPVNLKDCAPFGSQLSPALTAAQRELWQKHFDAGVRAQTARDFQAAVTSFAEAAKVDDTHAELAYRLGQCRAEMGDMAGAKAAFGQARDQDTLRFRTDSARNGVIREVAKAFAGRGVFLADAETSFAKASPGEVPGEAWFLEHVHFTFRGNWLLAATVLEALVQSGDPRLGTRGPAPPLTDVEGAERLAHTLVQEVKFGAVIGEQLLLSPPFTSQFDHAQMLQRWKDRLATFRKQLEDGGRAKALATAEAAVQANPGDWMLRMKLGDMLLEARRPEEAKEQYRWVTQHFRHYHAPYYMLGTMALEQNRGDLAEREFLEALRLAPADVDTQLGLARALEVQGKTAAAYEVFRQIVSAHPHRAFVHQSHGQFLAGIGRLPEALEAFNQAHRLDPQHAPTLAELGSLALRLGRPGEAIERFEAALKLDPELPGLKEQLADLRRRASGGSKPR